MNDIEFLRSENERLREELRTARVDVDFLRNDLRNTQLETERLRFQLTSDFRKIISDFSEIYPGSDWAEENLRAIMKHAIRALHRAGIDP